MNKTINERDLLHRWRGVIRGAALILATAGAGGCYDGTDGIPQFDVRPLSDAATSEGGGDGPRGDGGDARIDGAAADTGNPDAPIDGAAADTAPDAGAADTDTATDVATSPDDGAVG